MPGKAAKVTVTEKQFDILTEFSKARTEGVSLVQRSKIILLALEKHNNEAIEQKLGIGHDAVGKWRRRWPDAWDKLTVLQCNSTPAELKAAIRKLLADAPRAGRKPQITSEQQAAGNRQSLRRSPAIGPTDRHVDVRRIGCGAKTRPPIRCLSKKSKPSVTPRTDGRSLASRPSGNMNTVAMGRPVCLVIRTLRRVKFGARWFATPVPRRTLWRIWTG